MTKSSRGRLLLLPNLLGPHKHHQAFLPASVDKAVASMDGIIAESVSEGRRFLGHFDLDKNPNDVPLALLNKHSTADDMDFLLEPVREGESWGVISDAGLPCVADPGAQLVARARELGLRIQAFSGPSSLTLSLMLSGLPSQQFFFHGYVPREDNARKKKLADLEQLSKRYDATQGFIEAPHRNDELLEALLQGLSPDTVLCVAWDLTLPTQGVMTKRIREWKKLQVPKLAKRPATFLLKA